MSDIKEKTCVMKYFLSSIIYYKERLKFFKYQTNLQAITNNNTSIILSHYITSQQCIKSESGNVTSYINQEIKNSCQFNFNISNFSFIVYHATLILQKQIVSIQQKCRLNFVNIIFIQLEMVFQNDAQF